MLIARLIGTTGSMEAMVSVMLLSLASSFCHVKLRPTLSFFLSTDIVDCHKCMRYIVIQQLGDMNWRKHLLYVASDIMNSYNI